MKHLLTPLLLLSLAVAVLTGCTSTTEMISSGLRVELTGVQRDSSGTVRVTWRVHNPNIVAYVFSKSAHKISLDGTFVGTLEDTSPLGVPQFNHGERTGTLIPSGTAASQAIDQALARGSASYRQDSTLWVLILDDKLEKISLTGSGSVPASAQ